MNRNHISRCVKGKKMRESFFFHALIWRSWSILARPWKNWETCQAPWRSTKRPWPPNAIFVYISWFWSLLHQLLGDVSKMLDAAGRGMQTGLLCLWNVYRTRPATSFVDAPLLFWHNLFLRQAKAIREDPLLVHWRYSIAQYTRHHTHGHTVLFRYLQGIQTKIH